MNRILLVEDSEECQLVVRRTLHSPGHHLVCASSLKEARKLLLEASSSAPFHLIILDLGLPDGDGFALLDEIQAREDLRNTPVFLLTGSQDLNNKVTAFSLGADDYLVKPFNPIEFRARVEMRLRKLSSLRSNPAMIQRGSLIIDSALMQAKLVDSFSEERLDLTAKEFRILSFLTLNSGKTHTREDLVRAVWGPGVHVLARTVDSHICAIRRKLGRYSHYLQSVLGTGYRLSITPATLDSTDSLSASQTKFPEQSGPEQNA